ncbi:transcriptional regulator HexR [Saccharospirillum sp. MSK14-1]|uniref:transcriptional regulator HexR n=1 Tax=Saccharospirillum sp. MSK14-1 TaxID=1897632 RepID=UPI000D3B921E|nr:transcriptional regulator HexR [Saccharospirillum sp. MSK14-1]PTY36014.1 transcriptional regulator HexR [Saccharospirillum sp. MSK14-1]
MSLNILERLKSNPSCLSKSERKVAQVILEDPNKAIRSSIASLAKAANVSEPTVNRFCRSLDCTGFPDFKLKLAQCLATGTPYVNRNVEASDNVEEYSSKIFEATMSAISDAKRSIDPNALSRTVDALAQARRIEIYGLGASGSVAMDAQHKFFRMNTPCVAYTDVLQQRMAAAATKPGDVVIIISNTGRTIALVETARIARDSGATVIAITQPHSPLAEDSHILLGVDSPENTDIYTPMTSRIVHLTVIDVLATGVILKHGPEFQSHLKRIKAALADTRFKSAETD